MTTKVKITHEGGNHQVCVSIANHGHVRDEVLAAEGDSIEEYVHQAAVVTVTEGAAA